MAANLALPRFSSRQRVAGSWGNRNTPARLSRRRGVGISKRDGFREKPVPRNLDERLLHGPQAEEQVNLAIAAGLGELCLLGQREHRLRDAVEVAAGVAFLHVHAEAACRCEGDQSVLPNVRHCAVLSPSLRPSAPSYVAYGFPALRCRYTTRPQVTPQPSRRLCS